MSRVKKEPIEKIDTWDIDALIPDIVLQKAIIEGKEYQLVPAFSTRDILEFQRLMIRQANEELKTEEDFLEWLNALSEKLLVLFKRKHPEITKEFFLEIPTAKLIALSNLVLWKFFNSETGKATSEEDPPQQGTEDFNQTAGEAVMVKAKKE